MYMSMILNTIKITGFDIYYFFSKLNDSVLICPAFIPYDASVSIAASCMGPGPQMNARDDFFILYFSRSADDKRPDSKYISGNAEL